MNSIFTRLCLWAFCHASVFAGGPPQRNPSGLSDLEISDLLCAVELKAAGGASTARRVEIAGQSTPTVQVKQRRGRIEPIALAALSRVVRPSTHAAFHLGRVDSVLAIVTEEGRDPHQTFSNVIARDPYPGFLRIPSIEYSRQEVSDFWSEMATARRRSWKSGSPQAKTIRTLLFAEWQMIQKLEARYQKAARPERDGDAALVELKRHLITAARIFLQHYYDLWQTHFFRKYAFSDEDFSHLETLLTDGFRTWLSLQGSGFEVLRIPLDHKERAFIRLLPDETTNIGKAAALFERAKKNMPLGFCPFALIRWGTGGGMATTEHLFLSLGKMLLLEQDPERILTEIAGLKVMRKSLENVPMAFHGEFLHTSGVRPKLPGFTFIEQYATLTILKRVVADLRVANDEDAKVNFAFGTGLLAESLLNSGDVAKANFDRLRPYLKYSFAGDTTSWAARVDTVSVGQSSVYFVDTDVADAPRFVFRFPKEEGADSEPPAVIILAPPSRQIEIGFRVPLVGKTLEPIGDVLGVALTGKADSEPLDAAAKDALVLLLRGISAQTEVAEVVSAQLGVDLDAISELAASYVKDRRVEDYSHLIQKLETFEPVSIDRLTLRGPTTRTAQAALDWESELVPVRSLHADLWSREGLTTDLIDKIAMDAVMTDLERRGFKVHDHSKHNFGYDLAVSTNERGAKPLHVEVKGIQQQNGSAATFYMTRNELEFAFGEERGTFILALVVITKDKKTAVFYRTSDRGLGGVLESEAGRDFSLGRFLEMSQTHSWQQQLP